MLLPGAAVSAPRQGSDRRSRSSWSSAIPEVIIASWCGKAVKERTIRERPEWGRIDAVRNGHIYEVKSTYILQPGPAALTDGVQRLHDILATVVGA